MASNTNKKIILAGDPIYKEGLANAAITPGHLVERMSTGKIRVHATAGGNAMKMFAVEMDMVGDDIDTDYAANDTVRFVVARRGDEINALLAISATAVVIGSLVESAGDGTIRLHTAPTQAVAEGGSASYTIAPKVLAPIGICMEAVDNSGGSAVARVRIEIL